MEFLREWDGTLDGESPQAALYEAWYDATVRGLFEDDLGEDLAAGYTARRSLAAKAVDNLIQSGDTVVVRRRADAGAGDVRDAARADPAARAGRDERPPGHVEPRRSGDGTG